jgi:hypothetical protein
VLELPDVTLVAIFTVAHNITRWAVNDCLRRVRFGDVLLFTDRPHGGEVVVRKFGDAGDMGRFVRHEVPRHVKTSHALFVQWDSWVVSPEAWTGEFLGCDYIGAPWWYTDGQNVGNSGFCLRSRALMEYLSAHEDLFPIAEPEDHVLCREYRRRLPRFRWAPERLARRFSFERTASLPPEAVFGFHGIFNWPRVLPPGALAERLTLAAADPHVRGKVEWGEVERHLVEAA